MVRADGRHGPSAIGASPSANPVGDHESMTRPRNRASTNRIYAVLALAAGLACAVILHAAGGAVAQDLQSQLDSKRGQLGHANEREGVLSTELSRYSARLRQVAGAGASGHGLGA